MWCLKSTQGTSTLPRDKFKAHLAAESLFITPNSTHDATFDARSNTIRTLELRIKQVLTASNLDFSGILETPSYFVLSLTVSNHWRLWCVWHIKRIAQMYLGGFFSSFLWKYETHLVIIYLFMQMVHRFKFCDLCFILWLGWWYESVFLTFHNKDITLCRVPYHVDIRGDEERQTLLPGLLWICLMSRLVYPILILNTILFSHLVKWLEMCDVCVCVCVFIFFIIICFWFHNASFQWTRNHPHQRKVEMD